MTMSCESMNDVLAEYLAGELAPDQRASVDRHLETCASCRGRVAGLSAAQGAVRAMVVPREHAEALTAGLVLPGAPVVVRRSAWARRGAMAAVLALAFLAGYAARGTGTSAPQAGSPVAAAPAAGDVPRLVEAYQRAAAEHPGATTLAWGLMSVAKR